MQTLKKLEKSRGILAFAYNVESIDYIKIAKKTLSLASKKLNLPYTLITDKEFKNEYRNTRYDIDSNTFIQWKNSGRYHAYNLSPYDETLVIDVDYLVLNNDLNKIFDVDWDYILCRESIALTTEWSTKMGETSLPYIWATVFAFRKTERSKLFFYLVGKIQRNYHFYRSLFNVQERNYRNDYAFSIADVILNGYTIDKKSIPGRLIAINQPINSLDLNKNQIIIKDKNKSYVLPVTNLHVMSKAYLQSENFSYFCDRVLNES